MAFTTSLPAPEVAEKRSVDSARVVNECCDRAEVCRFQLMLSCNWTRARFFAQKPLGVELDLPAGYTLEQLRPNALCSVSFPFRTFLCAFLGHLLDAYAVSPELRRVAVTVPEKLTVTNLRQAFRVPIVRDSGFETSIRFADDREFTVQTNDITETAISVELSSEDIPLFSPGATVHVKFQYRGEVIEKRGQVHRLTESTCVIILSRPATDYQSRQAIRLQAAILSLQQLWLKSRLK